MKIELDASMVPEMEVSSTVASSNSNNSSDSDHSNEMPTIATVSAVSLNSSSANMHPNIENQFKVSAKMSIAKNKPSNSIRDQTHYLFSFLFFSIR